MLGDRIKELRTDAGMTQSDLAGELGVTKQSISNWETHNVIPPIDIICRLARHFGCTTDYLLEMDDRTFLIESNCLTASQARQIRDMVMEFEKLNRKAGLF